MMSSLLQTTLIPNQTYPPPICNNSPTYSLPKPASLTYAKPPDLAHHKISKVSPTQPPTDFHRQPGYKSLSL